MRKVRTSRKPKKKKSWRPRSHPYGGYDMASHQETLFAAGLDNLGATWMYEPEKLRWSPPFRKYTPDFKILRHDGSFFFVEYKGYLKPADKTKMRAIRKQYPDLDIRFVFQNAKKPSYKGSKSTYGDWARKNGYLWADGSMPKAWLEEDGYATNK